jgi:hypothetical protein
MIKIQERKVNQRVLKSGAKDIVEHQRQKDNIRREQKA